jgi:hypothetical protein
LPQFEFTKTPSKFGNKEKLDLYEKVFTFLNIGCSFKFRVKVGVEESIVNVPLASVQIKNTNNAKSEVRFKQPITVCNP